MSLFFELPGPQSQGRMWRTMQISRTSPPAGCSSTTMRGAGRLVAGQVADYQFVTGWLLVASWFLAARCWLLVLGFWCWGGACFSGESFSCFSCGWPSRYMEGSVDRDAGAMIRDGIKCMEKLGVCPEAVWKCLGRWMARDGVDGAVAGRWGASQSHVSLLFDVGLGLRLKGSGERTSNFIV